MIGRLTRILGASIAIGCSGGSASSIACAAFVDPTSEPMVDPSLLCAVDCQSGSAGSDVTVHAEASALHATTFVARVIQSQPASVDMTFTNAEASWSGDFYNLDDKASQLPLKLHVLIGRYPSEPEGNVQIYTDDATLTGGPVNVGAIACQPRGY